MQRWQLLRELKEQLQLLFMLKTRLAGLTMA